MEKNYKKRKMLHILSENARKTSKEISKEIKTSQQNANYLISRSIEAKEIKFFTLLVDSSKFGNSNFCVFIRTKTSSKSFLNSLSSEVKKYKEIISIDLLFGTYDVFIRFSVPNASYFNKLFREILTQYSTEILDYEILTQIVLYHFSANFLSKKKYEQKTIISGDRENATIDNTDKQIINMLNDNSRTNFSHIAKKLNTTAKTVMDRIKKLERKQVIKGYSVTLDHKKLEIHRFYLFLKFKTGDLNLDKEFTKFINFSSNVIEHIKVFGEWDSILVVETFNQNNFKELIYNIKEHFADSVEDYMFLESEDIKLWKYLPEL